MSSTFFMNVKISHLPQCGKIKNFLSQKNRHIHYWATSLVKNVTFTKFLPKKWEKISIISALCLLWLLFNFLNTSGMVQKNGKMCSFFLSKRMVTPQRNVWRRMLLLKPGDAQNIHINYHDYKSTIGQKEERLSKRRKVSNWVILWCQNHADIVKCLEIDLQWFSFKVKRQ